MGDIIKDIVNVDFIQALLIGIILSLIGLLGVTLKNKFKSYRENKKRLFDYIWKPGKPMLNDNEKIKIITEYKKTWKMIMKEDGFDIDIDSEKMIDGFEAFEQHLIKLVNTERDKYEIYKGINHGVSYILTDAKSDEEFNSMAFIVAKEIMKNEEEWIKEIHSIKKVKNENVIMIELGLKGIHEIVKVNALVIPSSIR